MLQMQEHPHSFFIEYILYLQFISLFLAPPFLKETLLKSKAHIAPNILIVVDFNSPLSSMD